MTVVRVRASCLLCLFRPMREEITFDQWEGEIILQSLDPLWDLLFSWDHSRSPCWQKMCRCPFLHVVVNVKQSSQNIYLIPQKIDPVLTLKHSKTDVGPQMVFAAICWIAISWLKFFEFQRFSCLWVGSSIKWNEIKLIWTSIRFNFKRSSEDRFSSNVSSGLEIVSNQVVSSSTCQIYPPLTVSYLFQLSAYLSSHFILFD